MPKPTLQLCLDSISTDFKIQVTNQLTLVHKTEPEEAKQYLHMKSSYVNPNQKSSNKQQYEYEVMLCPIGWMKVMRHKLTLERQGIQVPTSSTCAKQKLIDTRKFQDSSFIRSICICHSIKLLWDI